MMTQMQINKILLPQQFVKMLQKSFDQNSTLKKINDNIKKGKGDFIE